MSRSNLSPIADSPTRRAQANRENAGKSTGPRTDSGKARVAQNATTHGAFAQKLILPNEDREEFAHYYCSMYRSLNPQSAIQTFLAQRIIALAWRLNRLTAAEGNLHLTILDSALERLNKTEQRLSNMLHRAIRELKSLQKEAGDTDPDSGTDLLAEFLTPEDDAEDQDADDQVEELKSPNPSNAPPTTTVLQNKPKCQIDPHPATRAKPPINDYGRLTPITAAINAVNFASSSPPPPR